MKHLKIKFDPEENRKNSAKGTHGIYASPDIWANKYILDFQLAKHCFAILTAVPVKFLQNCRKFPHESVCINGNSLTSSWSLSSP